MVGYHWSLAWWFGADDCNFWCFHTNFYNQNTIISWKLQTISISNSKLWSVIFDTWTLKFTILLPVWSKNSACDTNSPQSWHNPYYSVLFGVRHTSAFHPINSSRCLNSLIKVAPYVLGVDSWVPGAPEPRMYPCSGYFLVVIESNPQIYIWKFEFFHFSNNISKTIMI